VWQIDAQTASRRRRSTVSHPTFLSADRTAIDRVVHTSISSKMRHRS
jgi:hypothetical protein